MASRTIDLLITYRVIKLLVTPWTKFDAYKLGIIDGNGKVLKKMRTLAGKEKNAYTILHRFIFNLKRIMKKVGLGGKIGSFAVALALLIREDKKYKDIAPILESAVIQHLKESGEYERLLQEEGDVIGFLPIGTQPFGTYFGVDVYEKGGELLSEQEYAKTL